jgi:nicotinate-nucleotide adenylyltransferase
MSKRRWIGVFGGSFNPPHLGHLLAAVYALKVFELDEIWFVPTYRHAFGKELWPFEDRMEMCERLISGLGPKFKVNPIEKTIRSDGKMLKTLEALSRKQKNCAFSLVIGSDILKQAKKWHRFDQIRDRFMVLVVPRGAKGNSKLAIPDINSSEIRRRWSRKDSIDGLVTPEVASYLGATEPNQSSRRR